MMHMHDDLPVRTYRVTLMDAAGSVHQIEVNTPCTCDMFDFVSGLDLPIVPMFMDIHEKKVSAINPE
jgi:hypothetical protein